MIIIADAGSTKIDWSVVSAAGDCRLFSSEGVNALMAGEAELHERFALALNSVVTAPDAIYYYGAGCVDAEVCAKVAGALRRVLRPAADAVVEVASDLLGAARSLCGRDPGIACILGTGSNSGFYDGVGLVDHIPSLGYLLGDEGGGAAIGRRLISAAYRRKLSPELTAAMERYLGLDYGGILRRVYSEPRPNAFLASLVPFVAENIRNEHVRRIVAEEFRSFFDGTVKAYGPVASTLPVHFVGGVAATFADILAQTATLVGLTDLGKIEARPLLGLIAYHTHSDI